ncbi:MAG TPA: hypothetical protein VFV57_05865 [Limnobacter sp.]|nr:hypothetical protein [Limnobacter sp.]
MTKSAQKAVKAHTARLVDAGGARFTIKLPPEANSILMAYCRDNRVSRTQAIIESLMTLNNLNKKSFEKVSISKRNATKKETTNE